MKNLKEYAEAAAERIKKSKSGSTQQKDEKKKSLKPVKTERKNEKK